MKYFVTLKFEETFEIEANSEDSAVQIAEQMFDPTQNAPELVEVWSDEDE